MEQVQQLLEQLDVPRGTLERLQRYAELLIEWQQRMNLVAPSTIDHLWQRHFQDSAQLAKLVPSGLNWVDIGAGGGFPAMVLAAMEWGSFTLVESIAKKCRFLETVKSELGLGDQVKIINDRIERIPSLQVNIATARATASLEKLIDWSLPHLLPGGVMLFPKGQSWAQEVQDAKRIFRFKLEDYPSETSPASRILLLRDIKKA